MSFRKIYRLHTKKWLIFNFWIIFNKDFIDRFAHGYSIGFSWPQKLPNDLTVFKSISWTHYTRLGMEKNINANDN